MTNNLQKYMKATLISIGVGIIALFFVMTIFALIITKFDTSQAVIDIFILIIAAIYGIVSGYMNGKMLKKNGIFAGILSGGMIVTIFLLLKFAFFGASFTGISLIKIAIIIVLSIVGSILGVNKKAKNKYLNSISNPLLRHVK